MKNLIYVLVAFLSFGSISFATTNHNTNHSATTFVRGYGNSFIFVEQGVEFAVFPDGQFDFNVDRYAPNFSAHANFNGVSISFNSGHSYDAYVQYDDYGAVIQIENVPLYYDHFGRIIQAGDVHIRYNHRGYITRVGGLYVHYNRYNRYSHCSGFINVYNRRYVYRPWHTYYVTPRIDLCIVFGRPYRQYYRPIRHTYYRPYRDNYRPRVSYNNGRRDRRVASTTRRSDRYRQQSTSRRDNNVTHNGRPLVRNERESKVTRRDDSNSQPRPMVRNDRNTGTQSRPMVSRTDRNDRVKPRINSQQRPKVTQRDNNKTKRTIRTRPQTSRTDMRNRNSSSSQRRVVKSTPKRKQTSTRSSSRSRTSKRSRM